MKRKILIIIAAVVTVSLVAFFFAYVGDYYKTDTAAVLSFSVKGDYSVNTDIEGMIVYEPEETDTALIFYPGGKVEYTAYEPLMKLCAQKGVMCILLRMPFNLAVFDINAANGICEKYPQIKNWYIGGHSLGGSMAAAHLAENPDDFDGLILLAAYSTSDLSAADVDVLSVYGSEDTVLNKEKYDECKSNLPQDFCERIIDGGCHAYFGMYGEQEGDGSATVTNEEQMNITSKEIARFVGVN